MLGKLLRFKTIMLLILVLALPLTALGADSNYLTTSHYKVYYDKWEDVAKAMDGKFLDAAYDTASSVMGTGLGGIISLYFYSNPRSETGGTFYPSGNYIKLNLSQGDSTSDADLTAYASVLAHETTHAIFNYLSHDSSTEANWLDEGLAYYAGDVAYPKSDAATTASLTAQLKYYSDNGKTTTSWFDTGKHYEDNQATSLDMVQFPALGNFFYSLGGSSLIKKALTNRGKGMSLEAALEDAYGKPSGMYNTDTSANTLYADYYRFYYGSS